MKKHREETKICKICHARKPLADFLLSAAGYLKKYGNVCHACRFKKHKKAFKVTAEDEDEGGKGGGLKIDYNAKLFEALRQEEKKEAIEEAKKEAHEETDELEALKEQEKQEKSKETKSRTTKSLIDRLANLLSRKKSIDSVVTNTLYTLYKMNSITDGILSAGTLKALGPEWGKRMVDFRRFTGINALVSLNVTYAGFSGKITEADQQGNELIQEAKKILDPTLSRGR
jgi:hypothetical protein